MHLSVVELEEAPQIEVLVPGEGLHILHHFGEECSVGSAKGTHVLAEMWTIQGGWGLSRRRGVYIPWAEELAVDVEVCDVVVLPGEDEPEDLACRGRGGEEDIWLGEVRLDSILPAPIQEGGNERL